MIRQGEHFEESLQWALSLTRLKRARFLHAFDDPDVMAGQGTVALELLSLRPDVVVLPIGQALHQVVEPFFMRPVSALLVSR